MALLVSSSSSRLVLKQSPTDPFQVRQLPSLGMARISAASISIECSSRPQKKATAHHIKTRPKKKGYDRRRKGPTRYPPVAERPAAWDILTPKPWALRALRIDDHPCLLSKNKPAAAPSGGDQAAAAAAAAAVEVEVVEP